MDTSHRRSLGLMLLRNAFRARRNHETNDVIVTCESESAKVEKSTAGTVSLQSPATTEELFSELLLHADSLLSNDFVNNGRC
jgi:hypothetical protein